MSFTYSTEGDRVVLSFETSAIWAISPGLQQAVQDFAKRRANAIGRVVEVFDNLEQNLLVTVEPD